jgi:hypothetical protein
LALRQRLQPLTHAGLLEQLPSFAAIAAAPVRLLLNRPWHVRLIFQP